MFQVELTHVSASSCLHIDLAITSVGLLLSTWSAFVVNRWQFASVIFAWSFFTQELKHFILVLHYWGVSVILLKLGYLGWDFSMSPSSFTVIRGSATWDFPSYIYHKLYPLFCRLEIRLSRATYQTHKHTGVLSCEIWLAYPLNHWCMVGIFIAVPRLRHTQKTIKQCRLDIWHMLSMIREI